MEAPLLDSESFSIKANAAFRNIVPNSAVLEAVVCEEDEGCCVDDVVDVLEEELVLLFVWEEEEGVLLGVSSDEGDCSKAGRGKPVRPAYGKEAWRCFSARSIPARTFSWRSNSDCKS